MGRRTLAVYMFLVVTLLVTGSAWAFQGPSEPAPSSTASAEPLPSVAPTPSAVPSATTPRPVRGPALRERNARRSRGASTASGVLFLLIVVGAMGYWVMRRLRR